MRQYLPRARQNVLAVAGLWASVAVAVREVRARQDALVDGGESVAALTDASGTVYSANPTLAR